MPTILSDPPEALYLLLGLVLVVAGGVWFSKRKRAAGVVFLVAVAVVALVVLIDVTYQSPRESAVRAVKDISDAVNARDWAAFDARVSKDFKYGDMTKANFREKLTGVVAMFDARTAVWGFDRDKVEQLGENKVAVVFDAKGDPKSGVAYLTHFKATFVRESDGEWRLIALAAYDYAPKTNGPEVMLPGVR